MFTSGPYSAFEEQEEVLDDFLGREDALKVSPTLFLSMVGKLVFMEWMTLCQLLQIAYFKLELCGKWGQATSLSSLLSSTSTIKVRNLERESE